MDRIPVKSSAIRSKGYNALTKDLEIEFTDGTIGAFINVSPDDSSWFDKQTSAGKAVWEFRRGGYTFEKGEK